MIPWWATLITFIAGVFFGVLLLAVTIAGRDK